MTEPGSGTASPMRVNRGSAAERCRMAQETAAQAWPRRASLGRHFWALALGSVGVVYGDIGEALYAFREAVTAAQGSGRLRERR